MLKNAVLYTRELQSLMKEAAYEERNKFFTFGSGFYWDVADNKNNEHGHLFVSIDENDKILGYIAYSVDWVTQSATQFGAISFESSVAYARDLKQAIDDVFFKYNLNRIEWYAFTDNPACRSYKRFIEKHGGRIAGMLRQNVKLMDGHLHDSYIFEILKEEYHV